MHQLQPQLALQPARAGIRAVKRDFRAIDEERQHFAFAGRAGFDFVAQRVQFVADFFRFGFFGKERAQVVEAGKAFLVGVFSGDAQIHRLRDFLYFVELARRARGDDDEVGFYGIQCFQIRLKQCANFFGVWRGEVGGEFFAGDADDFLAQSQRNQGVERADVVDGDALRRLGDFDFALCGFQRRRVAVCQKQGCRDGGQQFFHHGFSGGLVREMRI